MLQNSFAGLRQKVGNSACVALIMELLAIRMDIVLAGEWDDASGWGDPMNEHLAEELGRVRNTGALVTNHQSDGDGTDELADQKALREKRAREAGDENQKLLERYNDGNALTADDIQMPAIVSASGWLPFDFSGKDPEIPQMHGKKNVALLAFCNMIDSTCTMVSNLTCQGSGQTLPVNDAARVIAMLDSLMAILVSKGGTKKRRDIANGSNFTQQAADDVVGIDIEPAAPAGSVPN